MKKNSTVKRLPGEYEQAAKELTVGRTLARLARIDSELLRPIRHRSEKVQLDLTRIRVRTALVEARTGLINSAHGLAKALGCRNAPPTI